MTRRRGVRGRWLMRTDQLRARPPELERGERSTARMRRVQPGLSFIARTHADADNEAQPAVVRRTGPRTGRAETWDGQPLSESMPLEEVEALVREKNRGRRHPGT